MPKPQNPKLQLPPERFLQLQKIKEDMLASSASVALRELFREHAKAAGIEHSIPGIALRRRDDRIEIAFDDGTPGSFTLEGARELVRSIRERLATKGRQGPLLNLDHDYMLRGAGGAVAIRVGSVEKKLAPDVLEELADLIEAKLAQPAG